MSAQQKRLSIFLLMNMILSIVIFTNITNAAVLYVGTVPGDYATIQDAVNAASEIGVDEIYVRDGIYTENVNVNKLVIIQSVNGYASTSVVAADPNDHVFEITADYVTVTGLTIYGATGNGKAGIYAASTTYYVQPHGNRCGYDAEHMNYCGILLESSSDHRVSNNIASFNTYGIWVNSSDNNRIRNNICNSNSTAGVYLTGSSTNNTISSNIFNSNNQGIYASASGNTFSNNTCSSNGEGVLVIYSNNFSDNTITSNGTGMRILLIINTSILRGNLIENNTGRGITIQQSANPDLGSNDTSDKGRNTIRNNVSNQVENLTSNNINAYYNFWGENLTESDIEALIYDYDDNTSYGEILFNPWLNSDQSLPVELTTFTAKDSAGIVVLEWITESEVENDHFKLYRSLKGVIFKCCGLTFK